MKHVLVTGVGGSIGCHVMEHLLVNTDWEITGIDSFRHKGLSDRLHAKIYQSPRVRIFTHDLTAPISDILTNRIGHIDYIINLAAISDVDVSLDDPTYAIRTNTEVMLTMVEYVRRQWRYNQPHNRPVFLHISTDEVYGPTDGRTTHKEWDAIMPSNPYSASKACQEAIAIAYWRSYGLRLIMVNIMNNFGERQSGGKFPCIVQRAVRKGETITLHKFGGGYGSRYYLHSRNAADAMLFLLRNVTPHIHDPGTVDRPDRFNIVGDKQIDNRQFAEYIAKVLGKQLRTEDMIVTDQRPGHDGHYGLNGEKLARLGWKSPMTFEQSMKKCVLWYEENPEWLDPS
jgi:dTDP-glucose 4,6-dehydratase